MVKTITTCQHRGTNGRVSISNLAQRRSIGKYARSSFFLSSYIEGQYTTARIKIVLVELALEKENGVLILGSLYFHSQSDIRTKVETGHLQKTKSKSLCFTSEPIQFPRIRESLWRAQVVLTLEVQDCHPPLVMNREMCVELIVMSHKKMMNYVCDVNVFFLNTYLKG